VGGNVFQGAEDGLWDWRRGGKVSALWLESVLVGDVGQRDGNAFGGDVVAVSGGTIAVAGFLGLDAIAGLEGIVVVALGIGRVDVLAGDHGILVDVIRMDIGQHQGGEEAERLKRLHDHDLDPSGLTKSTH